MSENRTKPAESRPKRDVLKSPQRGTGRVTRAECMPPRALLDYIDHLGGRLKWCNTFYGGEMRAG